MLYYFILSLPFLLIAYRILLTNFIVPHFKKKALTDQLKLRADWQKIEKNETELKNLFAGSHGKFISMKHRLTHFIRNKEFIYGEIDFLSFYTILEKTKPQEGEVFYDLGSGAGKAVFAAGYYFNFSKTCGIELLEPLYKLAKNQLKKVPLTQVEFINENFLNYDFSDADIVYVAATCLDPSTWEQLINKMAKLKPGSRIIVATKSIQHEQFEPIHQGIELMSWGLCPVTIYLLTSTSQK